MTITAWILLGAVAGGAIGHFSTRGLLAVLTVPLGMIVVIKIYHAANAGELRSTSALDFIFGPLWPTLGAVPGFFVARAIRSCRTRNRPES